MSTETQGYCRPKGHLIAGRASLAVAALALFGLLLAAGERSYAVRAEAAACEQIGGVYARPHSFAKWRCVPVARPGVTP